MDKEAVEAVIARLWQTESDEVICFLCGRLAEAIDLESEAGHEALLLLKDRIEDLG